MALAETSTDLVPANGALAAVAQIEDIERQLPKALASGDVDWLRSVSTKAGIAGLWARREGFRQDANRVLRLKVRAEACIGIIDRRESPTLRGGGGRSGGVPALVWQGEIIASGPIRSRWRRLAVALERGALDEAMDAIERRGGGLGISEITEEVTRRGALHVPTAGLREHVHAYLGRTGLTHEALAAELGMTRGRLRLVFKPRATKAEARIEWPLAAAIAKGIGVNPESLPTAPQLHKRAKRPARAWLTRERKPTGSGWDSPYAHFRRALAEIQHLAPNAVTKYDEFYAHLRAVEDFIAKEMKRG